MIDRESRNQLVDTINRYLDHTIMAFAFDGEIHKIRDATEDATVEFVVHSLWFHYDDCKDHLAGLSKEEWDYFQRLILLLASDSEIEYISQRKWSGRQIVAGLALVCFGLVAVRLGFGWHLFGVALPFGPISILLSYWRNRSDMRQSKENLALTPFSSVSELRAIRKTATGFSKRQHPAGAGIRKVHSRLFVMVVWLQTWVLWSFISPLVLLFQTLPEKETDTRIQGTVA